MRKLTIGTATVLASLTLLGTASSALAAGVDVPAPDQGSGCTRHFTADVDTTKPMPVILKAGVSC